MPEPAPDETNPQIKERLQGLLKDSWADLNNRDDEKFGWEEARIVTAIGTAALGIGGLIVGAVAGWLVLPAVAAWAGATLAASAATGTALATGSLLGLNAAGWAGALAGVAIGALVSLVPLSRTTEKKTEYKIQSVLTPDIEHEVETDAFGRMSVDPRNLPHTKVNETLTTKSYRLGDLAEDTVGVTTGLVTAFAGAALGAGVAGLVKLAEVRQGIYGQTPRSGAKQPPTPPSA